MLARLIHRIGRKHVCRNTRLQIDEDDGWLVVRMIDKCTGASYEATYSPTTAGRVLDAMAEHVARIRQP